MWDQQETRREPLPAGTVLCTMNGQFTIQKYITSGGFALLYQAQEEGQMYPVILKEYFPRQGYVRVGGAILPEEAAALPENDPERKKRIEKMQTLFDERANREIRVGQQSRQRTRLTVPVDRKLSVRSIQLPGKDPCTPPYSCILEMECLTERQGFWLKDLLEEAAQPCSPDHPFGNGRPGCGNSVPQFAKTVDLFCALLANLKRIHSDEDGSGCIHGDISAGNLFVDGSLSDGTILAVSLLDFGSGWDEETGPESEVFSTPGFRAPELQNGGTPTPASDVYAVGRLFYALLDPTAANNLRLERDLSFLERYVTLTASQARPSGLEGSLLAQVNALLTAAAKDGTLRTAPGQTVQVLCRLENGGFGTGHNTVLSLLHSRVHFILNPDIQLTADTLSDLADWMAAHPGVVMTRPGLTFPDGRPQQLPLRRCNVRAMVYRQLPCLRFWAKYNDRYLMADKDLTKPTEIEFCTGSFSAVDTAAFKAVGGFDEGYFMYVEDADLTQKMRTRGKAYLVPQYTAIHAWHRAAHRSLKPFLWQLRSLLRYFSKWGFAW